MPAVERYTGAWATPDLIGREAILQQIDAAIHAAAGPSVVALYGPGGIGKTRILSDALRRQTGAAVYSAKHPVDLYNLRYHNSPDLAAAIHASLGIGDRTSFFRTFERARDRQLKAQAFGDVEEIAATAGEALQAFVADLKRFAQSHRVVIALDTLERVAYGASEQRPPFQVAPAWEWLVESLPDWNNVTLIVAGRNQIKHLFPALQSQPAIHLTPVEITPFTEDETNAYLEAVAKAAEVADEQAVADTLRSLTPQRRHQVHEYSGGLPILLALLADYISIAGFGRLPEIFETGADLAHARAVLEEQLIARMMEAGPIKDTLQILGRAPKGADAGLLAHLLGISLDEARNRLDTIRRLSFVKVRSDHFFLHDEMYAILQRQIYSAPDDAPEAERVNNGIIQWYAQQIDERRTSLDKLWELIEQPRHDTSYTPYIDYDRIAAVQQEILHLLIDQLSYHLRLNLLEGLREYVRLAFYAVFTGNMALDMQLQTEVLAFLDERDVSEEQVHIDKIEIEAVSALRPTTFLYAMNSYDGVVQEAQRLRRERPDLLATAGRTTEAALNVWEALARTGRAKEEDSAETDRLLDAAEQILLSIVRSAAPDVSEARRWRAQSLLALMHHARGFSLRARGQTRPAIEAYRRAAALWRQVNVPICLAWTLNNLGFIEVEEGNSANGMALIRESLDIRKRLGSRALIGVSYATLSRALVYVGEYQSAVENAERALRLFQAVEYRLGMGLTLRNLAEALRRSVRRGDDPQKRMAVLHEARHYAQEAYRLFEDIGDRLRQIESLIEEGVALCDMAGVTYDHSVPGEDLNELIRESLAALEQAATLAQQTDNTFRYVDAVINIAYLGFSTEQRDLIVRGLERAKEAIPARYLITRRGRPDPEGPHIRNRRLFAQLARINMLIGDRLFIGVHDPSLSRLQALAGEYESLATLFGTGAPAAITSANDALDRATRHYTLAFEYDRLHNPFDVRAQGAQNRVYDEMKALSADQLAVVASAIESVEQDYHLGKSAMRDLLESRALLFEGLV